MRRIQIRTVHDGLPSSFSPLCVYRVARSREDAFPPSDRTMCRTPSARASEVDVK